MFFVVSWRDTFVCSVLSAPPTTPNCGLWRARKLALYWREAMHEWVGEVDPTKAFEEFLQNRYFG